MAPDQMSRYIFQGLMNTPKCFPAFALFEGQGSALYNAKASIEAYYPRWAEVDALQSHADQVARLLAAEYAQTGRNINIIELGVGDGQKMYLLMQALADEGLLEHTTYRPIDHSASALSEILRTVSGWEFPVSVAPVNATFCEMGQHIKAAEHEINLVVWLGSTIGYLTSSQRYSMMDTLYEQLNPGDYLLVGLDLKKSPARIREAYCSEPNPAFFLNAIHVINHHLGLQLQAGDFRHVFDYNDESGEAFSRLQCQRDILCECGGYQFHFAKGESLYVCSHHKFTLDSFCTLMQFHGFEPRITIQDNDCLIADCLTQRALKRLPLRDATNALKDIANIVMGSPFDIASF
ncbi:Histidine N-alpha-methyltransferase [BD1-7 clade bacterium]|uniref:Histidine N-alpha-methyltransferase n=1 Tax=BD1-7 clade bacterium TaxID=2029982 RepID=A0A5S9PKA1_9GAMM|nr:Histidine N-alpha-methyltransferase [BD1-7 clade bacterium]CAA0104131.1 Histidine N-alpha-methyltransferase [BD1-7 clade bacterium]